MSFKVERNTSELLLLYMSFDVAPNWFLQRTKNDDMYSSLHACTGGRNHQLRYLLRWDLT